MNAVVSTLLAGLSVVLLSAGQALAGTGGGNVITSISVIPEPSSFALIAAGAAVVAWAKFRRRG